MRSEVGVCPGRPLPLGAHRRDNGVNFAVFSRHATSVRLDLFDHPDNPKPSRTIKLDPSRHRTGDIWHVWIEGVGADQLYGFRLDGPYAPSEGHRFNANRLLLDPCAKAVAFPRALDFGMARGFDPEAQPADQPSLLDNAATAPRSIVIDDRFDWGEDRSPCTPWAQTVIYELHPRGYTAHPSAGVTHPGTYRGLIEKIPYLCDLGVTAIELLPVQEFAESLLERINPQTGARLTNYWGYDPLAWFAPRRAYSSDPALNGAVTEFKTMVRAFHAAGLEIVLDLVFNHTGEGNRLGPTLSFRGLDNQIYYLLEEDPNHYRDLTGTGNTVRAGHPVVGDLIVECLRYWATEFRVDGFRFDLATILGRDSAGKLCSDAPLLERIAEDPVLRGVKLIAEPWDPGGGYWVGSFSTGRWSEWNGRFRDDVRRYWRGDAGLTGIFASRISGSSDLYQGDGKGPESSVNFLTCHDGFTLNDLVSFREKHNVANGENNQDGQNENYSDNCGVEGETDDPAVQARRTRQIKNFLLTLLISRGTPMLLAGDEFRRTQRGNNNAYCQDNEIGWIDWSNGERFAEIRRFTRGMIAFRRRHRVLAEEHFYTNADVQWYGPDGQPPHWDDRGSDCLGMHLVGEGGPALLLLFNPGGGSVSFRLPTPPSGGAWSLAVDTAAPAPHDLSDPGAEPPLRDQSQCPLAPRSSVILLETRRE